MQLSVMALGSVPSMGCRGGELGFVQAPVKTLSIVCGFDFDFHVNPGFSKSLGSSDPKECLDTQLS